MVEMELKKLIEYDHFGAAASSCSISSALGIAEADNFPTNQIMS